MKTPDNFLSLLDIRGIRFTRDKEYAEVGKEYLLVCKAPGSPTPSVTWLKADKGPLPPSYSVKDNNTLRNKNVKLVDSANFTCTAKNIAGSQSSTVEVIASGKNRYLFAVVGIEHWLSLYNHLEWILHTKVYILVINTNYWFWVAYHRISGI